MVNVVNNQKSHYFKKTECQPAPSLVPEYGGEQSGTNIGIVNYVI